MNTLVSGDSGTGKTAAVKAFVRSLMCPHRDVDTGTPCGKCQACMTFDVRYDSTGLFAYLQERAKGTGQPVHFNPINCGEVTETLRTILTERHDYEGRYVIYLDEVHRLMRRKMEHMLLVPLQEMDALWVASSAMSSELDSMFRRRFSAKLSTTLPDMPALIEFLRERCQHWRVSVDDDPGTFALLAQRSRRITSEAIGRIAVAAGRKDRCLTRELVLCPFD